MTTLQALTGSEIAKIATALRVFTQYSSEKKIPLDQAEFKSMFGRTKLVQYHPDHGGDKNIFDQASLARATLEPLADELFPLLNKLKEEILKQIQPTSNTEEKTASSQNPLEVWFNDPAFLFKLFVVNQGREKYGCDPIDFSVFRESLSSNVLQSLKILLSDDIFMHGYRRENSIKELIQKCKDFEQHKNTILLNAKTLLEERHKLDIFVNYFENGKCGKFDVALKLGNELRWKLLREVLDDYFASVDDEKQRLDRDTQRELAVKARRYGGGCTEAPNKLSISHHFSCIRRLFDTLQPYLQEIENSITKLKNIRSQLVGEDTEESKQKVVQINIAIQAIRERCNDMIRQEVAILKKSRSSEEDPRSLPRIQEGVGKTIKQYINNDIIGSSRNLISSFVKASFGVLLAAPMLVMIPVVGIQAYKRILGGFFTTRTKSTLLEMQDNFEKPPTLHS